jgi:hypothetical protein
MRDDMVNGDHGGVRPDSIGFISTKANARRIQMKVIHSPWKISLLIFTLLTLNLSGKNRKSESVT